MSSIINTSRIAVVGLGQLGGSLIKRINAIGCTSVYAVARNESTIEIAMDLELLDAASTDAADILPVVDITFICLPLSATIDFVRMNVEHFRPGSIVTDIGSVKGPIVEAVRPPLLERGVYFVGGHPMAGTEKSGFEHSRPDLYENAIVFLTPTEDDEPMAVDMVQTFWRDIGACPIEIAADRHDAAVAYSSHVLHYAAAMLTKTVLNNGDIEGKTMAAAGGFRDTTRIAMSDPDMWTEITTFNRDHILAAVDTLQKELESVRNSLVASEFDDLNTYLRTAGNLRRMWCDPNGSKRGHV